MDVVAPDRDWLEPEAEHVDEPAPTWATGRARLRTTTSTPTLPSPIGEADEDAEFEDSTTERDDRVGSPSPPPGKMESWRKRSATGAVLTGLALGFQQVFEKEREEPAIIMTTSGDPPRDLPVEAEVEHGRPRRSVVNIRPWLLDRGASGPARTRLPTPTDTDPTTGDRHRPTPTRDRPDRPPAGSPPEGD